MSGSFFAYNRNHPYYPYDFYNGDKTVPSYDRLTRLNSFHPNYHGYFIPQVQLHDFYYHPHDHLFNDTFGHDYGYYPGGITTPYIHRKSEYWAGSGCPTHQFYYHE
jgi:hypothetical protein